jgi:hypothetical protein
LCWAPCGRCRRRPSRVSHAWDYAAIFAKAYLGGQDVLVARPREFFQRLAHFELALAGSVDLGSIKEVDTMVPSSLHAIFDDGTLDLIRNGHCVHVRFKPFWVPPYVSHPPSESTETLSPCSLLIHVLDVVCTQRGFVPPVPTS